MPSKAFLVRNCELRNLKKEFSVSLPKVAICHRKPLTAKQATYTFNFELWIFLHNVWFHIFQIYLVKQIDWITKPAKLDL